MKRNNTILILSLIVLCGLIIMICGVWLSNDRREEMDAGELYFSPNSKGWDILVINDDTLIGGDITKCAKDQFRQSLVLRRQLRASQELLETLNCVYIPDSIQLNKYYAAKRKYWIQMGWDTTTMYKACGE